MTMLKISNLKVYYGQMEAVHGIDKKVSITAIIGYNGAGKTTILNAISGSVEYTGTSELDGKPLSNKSNRVVKAGVVQVPEGRKVFAGLSVEENLRAGAYCIRSKKEVARLMEEQYKLFPRLRERKHQDAGTLSGGEQQMLVICRSLMAKPRLLHSGEQSEGHAAFIV